MSIDKLNSLGWHVATFVNLTNRSANPDETNEINAIAENSRDSGVLLYLHDDFLSSLDRQEYEGYSHADGWAEFCAAAAAGVALPPAPAP